MRKGRGEQRGRGVVNNKGEERGKNEAGMMTKRVEISADWQLGR
jgi:hypothetical protein